MKLLTNRQLFILQSIIDDFIIEAKPIGSRAISKKDSVNLSAATIRNVMADLEDMGFLEKTHSSSGRVPSEKAYRFYVDHVIGPTLREIEMDIIREMISENIVEFEYIVQTSAEVLSQLTNYTTIILGPQVIDATLREIQIIILSDYTAVAILVTDTGHVEHKTFSSSTIMDEGEVETIVNILNDRLAGVPILHLSHKLETEVYSLLQKYVKNFNSIYQYLQNILAHESAAKLYIGGQSNLIMQPEFNDIEKIYEFYSLLENEEEMVRLLSMSGNGLHVTIGNENKLDAIKHLSLITSSYKSGLNQFGTIALIGPTRMEYRKVIRLLKGLSSELSNLLYKSSD